MVPSLPLLSCESSVSVEENADKKNIERRIIITVIITVITSCLSQSSLIISPTPSSLPRSNLPSVKKIFQSSTSQSLSATARPFNLKCQNFLLNCLTVPPKFQTSASPTFRQMFSHRSRQLLTKLSKLITSPTSSSSSIETPQ